MKKFLITGAMIAGLYAAGASAGDPMSECEEFAANNGVPAEPCGCIVDAISADADLAAEQAALVTMEDYDNASDELHAAVDPCLEG